MSENRFEIGDRVRIDDRAEPRHHRVPSYVKGQTGTVVRVCDEQGRPEVLSVQDSDTVSVPVYRVQLAQTDLWPGYSGAHQDTLEIEMFEHWLRPDDAMGADA